MDSKVATRNRLSEIRLKETLKQLDREHNMSKRYLKRDIMHIRRELRSVKSHTGTIAEEESTTTSKDDAAEIKTKKAAANDELEENVFDDNESVKSKSTISTVNTVTTNMSKSSNLRLLSTSDQVKKDDNNTTNKVKKSKSISSVPTTATSSSSSSSKQAQQPKLPTVLKPHELASLLKAQDNKSSTTTTTTTNASKKSGSTLRTANLSGSTVMSLLSDSVTFKCDHYLHIEPLSANKIAEQKKRDPIFAKRMERFEGFRAVGKAPVFDERDVIVRKPPSNSLSVAKQKREILDMVAAQAAANAAQRGENAQCNEQMQKNLLNTRVATFIKDYQLIT